MKDDPALSQSSHKKLIYADTQREVDVNIRLIEQLDQHKTCDIQGCVASSPKNNGLKTWRICCFWRICFLADMMKLADMLNLNLKSTQIFCVLISLVGDPLSIFVPLLVKRIFCKKK